MNGGPPPPPPHGSHAGARGGLPDGNYDIFIIPPHSAGSGFLYLPSLQPHRNSFLAGVGCTVLVVSIWTIVFPVLREWFAKIVASGGMAVIILMIGVGVVGWAWGKTQLETGGPGDRDAGAAPNAGHRTTSGQAPGPESSRAPPPQSGPPPQSESRAPPKSSWQRASANSGSAGANTGTNGGTWEKGSWEKAREETRKREEERRKADELKKKREDEEKERIRQREKDAAERLAREKREREARERARTAAGAPPSTSNPRFSRPPSPAKSRHQQPTAKTATDDDAFSYRPYDNPKRPSYKTSASSIYSESSYAPSHSTSRTTPPPSHRGPYRCKDPDKIVIKAVYSFNNTFTKVPVAQLVSGMGTVTDGLVLRITTEGLFIDDDVRGVPQREWDVKAWTLKLVEVWCPHLHVHVLGANPGSGSASASGFAATPAPAAASASLAARAAATTAAGHKSFFGRWWTTKVPSEEDSDTFVAALTRVCTSAAATVTNPVHTSKTNQSSVAPSSQTGEFKSLHVVRASIRDTEGKRYVFVLQADESWKVAVGLQRLRRGTQVRALGVSGMAQNESKAILENAGWV